MVFKVKRNTDGSISQYKARLVAKGFHQAADIDYSETFIRVVKPITIRVLFTLTLANGWDLPQIDINNAFLHDLLHETIFMEQPIGFTNPGSGQLVCKLKKALYGLKQSPRAWFEWLSTFLIQLGFIGFKADPSLFFRFQGGHRCNILIYVDDIVLTGSSNIEIQTLISALHSKFSLKDLGKLSYFLGIEVFYPTTDSIFLSQSKYVTDLL